MDRRAVLQQELHVFNVAFVDCLREGSFILPSFERDADLDTLVIPTQIPDESFCDWVHMNPQGRAIYSTWLIATLGNLLQDIGS